MVLLRHIDKLSHLINWLGNSLSLNILLFLHDNVTKTYKKAPPKFKASINLEAKNIAELINLDDRIECIARTLDFITLKDHKPDFRQNPLCRLINLAKNELGKVSKLIIEKINKKLISELHFNQWKNTNSVLKWFIDISNKKDCSFIQLDIKEFYPSINEDILTKTSLQNCILPLMIKIFV